MSRKTVTGETKALTVEFNADCLEKMRQYAEKDDRTLASLIRIAVKEKVERLEANA